MKNKFNFLALAMTALVLGACNNDDDEKVVTGKQITVDASIGVMTRVETVGNASTFEAGDQINVYAWTGVADKVPDERVVDGSVNTYDGTTWSANPQMLWADMVSDHYFLAVYPSHEITDFEADPYTLDTSDQETSDLLIAVNNGGLTASNESVQLTFDHAMAKLVVNLHFRSQWSVTPDVESVKLEGYTSAEVDYMTMTATGTTAGDVTLSTLAEAPDNFELACSSIVIPSTDTKTIRIRIDNVDYVYNHDTYIPLERGKYTTINLNVGRDAVTLAGVTVGAWEEGETLTGGEAEEVITSYTINGHEYVDLGLSVKWATCNVGADSPEEYGDYYAWGETATKTEYTEENSIFYGNSTVEIDGVTYSEDEIGGNDATDAARANWGGTWRLPTTEEFEELIDDCTWDWTMQGGSNGYLVTGGNGNSIFLPAAGWRYGSSFDLAGTSGRYWSSTPDGNTGGACILGFGSGYHSTYWLYRYRGQSVRPVSE